MAGKNKNDEKMRKWCICTRIGKAVTENVKIMIGIFVLKFNRSRKVRV